MNKLKRTIVIGAVCCALSLNAFGSGAMTAEQDGKKPPPKVPVEVEKAPKKDPPPPRRDDDNNKSDKNDKDKKDKKPPTGLYLRMFSS